MEAHRPIAYGKSKTLNWSWHVVSSCYLINLERTPKFWGPLIGAEMLKPGLFAGWICASTVWISWLDLWFQVFSVHRKENSWYEFGLMVLVDGRWRENFWLRVDLLISVDLRGSSLMLMVLESEGSAIVFTPQKIVKPSALMIKFNCFRHSSPA